MADCRCWTHWSRLTATFLPAVYTCYESLSLVPSSETALSGANPARFTCLPAFGITLRLDNAYLVERMRSVQASHLYIIDSWISFTQGDVFEVDKSKDWNQPQQFLAQCVHWLQDIAWTFCISRCSENFDLWCPFQVTLEPAGLQDDQWSQAWYVEQT